MVVLTGITNSVRSTIAGRLNSAASSGLGSLRNTTIEGATSALDAISKKTKFSTTVLSYPANVTDDPQQGHYIVFNVNAFTPGKAKSPKMNKL